MLRDASTGSMCQHLAHSLSDAFYHLRSSHPPRERFRDPDTPYDLTSMGCASCVSCREVFTLSQFVNHRCCAPPSSTPTALALHSGSGPYSSSTDSSSSEPPPDSNPSNINPSSSESSLAPSSNPATLDPPQPPPSALTLLASRLPAARQSLSLSPCALSLGSGSGSDSGSGSLPLLSLFLSLSARQAQAQPCCSLSLSLSLSLPLSLCSISLLYSLQSASLSLSLSLFLSQPLFLSLLRLVQAIGRSFELLCAIDFPSSFCALAVLAGVYSYCILAI